MKTRTYKKYIMNESKDIIRGRNVVLKIPTFELPVKVTATLYNPDEGDVSWIERAEMSFDMDISDRATRIFEGIVAEAISKAFKKELSDVNFEGKHQVDGWEAIFPDTITFPMKKNKEPIGGEFNER